MEEKYDLKALVKRGLPKGNYIKVRNKIKTVPAEILPYLSKRDKKKIIDMAMRLGNEDILKQMLDIMTYEEKVTAITYIYKDKLYVSYEACFQKHLDAFLEVGLNLGHNRLLFHIARIVSKNKEIYTKEIDRLKNYFKTQEVDEVIVAIAHLDGFKGSFFEEKIFASEIEYKIEYLVNSNINKVDDLFKKLEFYPLTEDDIKKIVFEIEDNQQLFVKFLHSIISYVSNAYLKSKYLLAVFMTIKNFEYYDYLIEQIFMLNILKDIQALVLLMDDKRLIKYSKKALESNNYILIIYLAWITDTHMTFRLIDFVLTADDYNIVCLLSNLQDKYLIYALNKILNNRGWLKYLEILNILELMGLPNGAKMLDFILNSKVPIPADALDNLKKHQQEKYGNEFVLRKLILKL